MKRILQGSCKIWSFRFKQRGPGLVAFSYAALCLAANLRTASLSDQQVTVSTTNPLMGAVLETEGYLNTTINRFSNELATMRSQLTRMNTSMTNWTFNIGVMEKSKDKDEGLIANNTKLIKETKESAGFAKMKTKTDEITADIKKKNATRLELAGEIMGSAKDAHGKTVSPEDTMKLLTRITKVKNNYLLNSTKMAGTLKRMKQLERDLSMNSTIITEWQLRRAVDDALAEIPRELQGQLEDTLKNVIIIKLLLYYTTSQ